MRGYDPGPARYVLGGYREYPPPPGLAHALDGSWTYALPSGSPAAAGHQVLPDTGLSLCFWLREDRSRRPDVSLVVVGPVHGVRRGAEPGARLEAVRLRPEWSLELLGIDPSEHADAITPLSQIRPRAAARLLDRYARSRIRRAGLRVLLEELQNRSGPPPSRAATLAARGLAHIRSTCATNIRLDTVSRELGISERHLRRIIREATGFGPKHHHRLARMNRAVLAADHDPDPDWSRLAARHGFYDQSHMIREFRCLTGASPVEVHSTRLLEALASSPGTSDGTPTGPPGLAVAGFVGRTT